VRLTEREAVALREPDPSDPQLRCPRAQRAHARAGAGHARLGDAADAVARHEATQTTGVVLVWVCQHDEVDAAIPERDALVEPAHQQVGVGATIHEDPAAAGRFEEDGIALPDVEHGQPEGGRPPCHQRDAADRDEDRGEADQGRSTVPMGRPGASPGVCIGGCVRAWSRARPGGERG
jgi:hypothetical protein